MCFATISKVELLNFLIHRPYFTRPFRTILILILSLFILAFLHRVIFSDPALLSKDKLFFNLKILSIKASEKWHSVLILFKLQTFNFISKV
jgi:hypothetical protein